MPVRKFKSLLEMEDALWRIPGAPELYRAIASVWDFAACTVQKSFPPGVYKHRSIESAQRQRDAWEEENFRAYWRRQSEVQKR